MSAMYHVLIMRDRPHSSKGPSREWKAFRDTLAAFLEGRPLYRRQLPRPIQMRPKPPRGWHDFLHGPPLKAFDEVSPMVGRRPGRASDAHECFQWLAEHYEWTVIKWYNTFFEFTFAFITASPDLVARFEAAWRAQPDACAWDDLRGDGQTPMLIGSYALSDPHMAYRTVLFSEGDGNQDGTTVWTVCNCSDHSPLVCLWGPDRAWRNEGWKNHFDLVAGPQEFKWFGLSRYSGLVRPRTFDSVFLLVGHPDTEDDADDERTVFMDDFCWIILQGDVDVLGVAGDAVRLGFRDIAVVLQHSDWVYGQHTGGGPDEYYNVFASRDAKRTGELIRRIESNPGEYYGISGLF